MAIYFLMYHAKPTKEHEDAVNIGGGYVNCYVDANKIKEAEKISSSIIEELNWNILKKEEAYIVTREDFDEGSSGLQYYEQALTDKTVFAFHTYPVE